MTSLAGLSFRFTTADDFDVIKSIAPDLDPDREYILESYLSLIQDPLCYGVLAEIHGEAVSFVLATVQMGGIKVYSRAGRTKVAWRNRGIFGMLQKFVRETLRDTVYPQLEYEEFTTDDNQPSIQKLIKSPHYTEVFRKPFLTFEFGTMDLEGLQIPDQDIRDVGIDGVRRILKTPSMRDAFFPVRLFVGYVNFQPEESELPLFASHNPFILASGDPDRATVSQLTIGSKLTSKVVVIHWIVPPCTEPSSVAVGFKDHLKLMWKQLLAPQSGGKCDIYYEPEYRQAVEVASTDLGCSVVEPYATECIGYRRKF